MNSMITGLNHITLAVADLERSFRFYVEVLGCKPIARWAEGAYLTAGDTWLAILLDTKVGSMQRPDYSHVAFSCAQEDFSQLVEALRAGGHPSWSDNKSEGDSFYFEDPDGHKLEIHVGDLASRLEAMKEKPWGEIRFFDQT